MATFSFFSAQREVAMILWKRWVFWIIVKKNPFSAFFGSVRFFFEPFIWSKGTRRFHSWFRLEKIYFCQTFFCTLRLFRRKIEKQQRFATTDGKCMENIIFEGDFFQIRSNLWPSQSVSFRKEIVFFLLAWQPAFCNLFFSSGLFFMPCRNPRPFSHVN